MAGPSKDDFSELSQALYQKNLELVNTNREIELVKKLYEVMSRSTTLVALAQESIEIIVKDLGCVGGARYYDKKKKDLKTIATTIPSFHPTYHVARSRSLRAEVFRTGESRLIDGLPPELQEVLGGMKIKATLAYPLRFGSVRIGTYGLFLKTSATMITDTERRMFDQVATVFSAAVERMVLYQELQKANRHLSKLSKMKSEFVNVATHELRNPVAGIRGFVGMIRDGLYGDIPESLQEPIRMIGQCNELMVELVDDLLQIARSEVKRIKMVIEPVDLSEVMTEKIQIVSVVAKGKGLKIEYDRPNTPMIVKADKQRVGEMIHNLLSNAVKYSEKGVITVSHKVMGGKVVTDIMDQGLGISEEDQAKLFSRFFRAREGIAHGVPGTGLGLYIVKQYIEKMNGTIRVTSVVGEGSTFSFELPKC